MTATWCLTCHSQDTCTFDMLPEQDVVPSDTFIAEWDRMRTDIQAAKIPEHVKQALLADAGRIRMRMGSLRDRMLRKAGFIP